MSFARLSAGLVGALGLLTSAIAAVPARPGAVNFLEGSVSINGRDVTSSAIGSATLPAGSVLRTASGRAEVLLTPGVLLRIGQNSEVRMLSAGLLDTSLVVDRGVALLEASDLNKETSLHIGSAGLDTAIKDEGLYRFDAGRASVAVFKGKAEVRRNDEKVELKKGKTVTSSPAPLKPEKFDVGEAKKTDELYKWSKVRSEYLSEASEATAQRMIVQPGLWAGSGWYWNPWLRTYSWLPSASAMFSPFGYGFYSPWSYYPRPRYIVPRYRSYPPRIHGGGRMGPRPAPRSFPRGGHRRGR